MVVVVERLALFDMDGTLSPSRLPVPAEVKLMLKQLQAAGVAVGVVTGSDLPKVKEQFGEGWDQARSLATRDADR